MKNVLILSSSDGHNDSRVFKQVKALKRAGFEVQMISRATEQFPETHVYQGVTIHRVDVFSKSLLSEKSIELADQLLFESSIHRKVKDHISIYESFHATLKKIDDSTSKIKRLRVKLDTDYQDFCSLWRKSSRNPFKFIGYKLWSLCPLLDIFRTIVEMRKVRKDRAHCSAKFGLYKDEIKDQILNITFFLRPFWTYQAITNKFDSDFFQNFDVIHVHDIYPLVAGYALAKETGARLIYDAHEIEPERVPPLPEDRKNYIISLENAILPFTSKLITVGHECEKYYQKNYKLNSSGVIYNSPLTKTASELRDIKQELGFDQGRKILLYVGAVGSTGRGLDKVIAALPMLNKDIYLVVLGPRHKINDAKIQKEASRFNVSHRLILMPPVNHEILVTYIGSADVGVCPIQDISLSYRYSMPNKLFEMAFAGIPICCSDLPEMKKFVESHGIGKSFNEKDPTSIAATIKEVLANRSKYSLDETSVVKLTKEYSWERQELKLISIYNEIFQVDGPLQSS